MTAVVDVERKPLVQVAERDSYTSEVLAVPLRKVAVITVGLPLFGFIFCIIYTYYYNFQASVYTHCEVSNFAPSISASIGSFVPQRYVWQFCVALHSAPRLLFVALDVRRIVQRVVRTSVNLYLAGSCFWLQLAENAALLILTIVSSKENFTIHKLAFGTFVFTSVAYMLLACYLQSRHCGYSAENLIERKSQTCKWNLTKATLATGFLLLFFYWRHNEYCEPYVYSFFCLCEYTLVILNMAFHMTAYFDFFDSDLRIPTPFAGLPYNSSK